jgi:hypothetical protein
VSGYVPLPRAWRELRNDVSATAQAVYVDLLLRMDQRTGVVRTTSAATAAGLHIGRTSAYRALKALESAGIITISPASNQHQRTELVVLLRHGAVPPVDKMRNSTGTAHPRSPAETRPLDFQDSQDIRAVPRVEQQSYDHEKDWQ